MEEEIPYFDLPTEEEIKDFEENNTLSKIEKDCFEIVFFIRKMKEFNNMFYKHI